MKTNLFTDIESEFNTRVQKMIWCNVSTISPQQRPRSRIMHPVWDGSTGWVTSRRHAPKAKHLSDNPYISLAYIADVAKPLYVECLAEWEDDMDEKIRVWDFLKSIPEPYGFDPATLFQSQDDPKYGLLRLTPWRIELGNLPEPAHIWYAPNNAF